MGAANRRRQLMGAAYGQPPRWAWHYTLGRKIPRILRDGALRDAWMDRNRQQMGHRAPYCVWFTTSERVDPTSSAALSQQQAYPGDPAAFKAMAGGHWRIGIPTDHPALMTYRQVLESFPAHTMPGRFFRSLERMGENRNAWRIALEAMPLAGCCIQEQIADGWVDHPIESLNLADDGPGYGLPGLMELDSLPQPRDLMGMAG